MLGRVRSTNVQSSEIPWRPRDNMQSSAGFSLPRGLHEAGVPPLIRALIQLRPGPRPRRVSEGIEIERLHKLQVCGLARPWF